MPTNGGGVKVKVKQTGRVKKPKLDGGQMQFIGEKMVEEQFLRWGKAINADGNPAKPLTRGSFFKKRAYTGNTSPKRDNVMTGLLKKNFSLRKAIDTQIRAENSTREARAHALRAQKAEEMIGFAGSDQNVVFRAAQLQYAKYLTKAWLELKR